MIPSPEVISDGEWLAVPLWVRNSLRLYNRCRMFNEIALPEKGGVLDQNEMIVSILETIHQTYNEIMREQQEDRINAAKGQGGTSTSWSMGQSYSRRKKR